MERTYKNPTEDASLTGLPREGRKPVRKAIDNSDSKRETRLANNESIRE